MSVCGTPTQKPSGWKNRWPFTGTRLFLQVLGPRGSPQSWPHPRPPMVEQAAALCRWICLLSSWAEQAVRLSEAPTQNRGSTLPPLTRPLSEHRGRRRPQKLKLLSTGHQPDLLMLDTQLYNDDSAVDPTFNLSSFMLWRSKKKIPNRVKLHIFKAHIKARKLQLISLLQHPLPPTLRPQTDFSDPWGVLILFITVSFPG